MHRGKRCEINDLWVSSQKLWKAGGVGKPPRHLIKDGWAKWGLMVSVEGIPWVLHFRSVGTGYRKDTWAVNTYCSRANGALCFWQAKYDGSPGSHIHGLCWWVMMGRLHESITAPASQAEPSSCHLESPQASGCSMEAFHMFKLWVSEWETGEWWDKQGQEWAISVYFFVQSTEYWLLGRQMLIPSRVEEEAVALWQNIWIGYRLVLGLIPDISS